MLGRGMVPASRFPGVSTSPVIPQAVKHEPDAQFTQFSWRVADFASIAILNRSFPPFGEKRTYENVNAGDCCDGKGERLRLNMARVVRSHPVPPGPCGCHILQPADLP